MYPTLYNSNETNFVHNGIGFLRDAITVYPEEELNGYSEITIEYDADGFLADQIKNGMIIKAKANDKQQPQLFRIYSHVKDHAADQIIINGRHITNDLADNFVEKLEIRNLTTYQAMKAIQEAMAYPTRFNLSSTNTTTQSSTNIYRNNPLQMVAGTEGSILQIWGGQIERDNFNLIMHRRRGSDDGVKVLYKKNLTGLQAIFDDDNIVTRIYPFKYVEETEEERARLITVPGKYIDSPNIDKYTHIKIMPIDASSEEGIETSQDLYNAYKEYFNNEGKDKDLPSISMEVEFEHLHETEEYKDVAALEHVGLGDTITVAHSKMGLDLQATIVKIEYDSIAEKNRKVSAGNVKASFTDSVNQNANDLGIIGENMNKIDQKSNEAIRAANGKNTIYYGPDEPAGDHLIKGDMWFRIVDGEYTRTYIYDGVQWQLSIDMESKEAKETAAEARNRANDANEKANLATENANEAIAGAQEAFDKAQSSMTRADSAFSKADALSKVVDEHTGDISSVTQIAQGLQTKVSDAEGNISKLQQTSTSYGTRIKDAEDNVSTLTQTAQGLQTRVQTAEGNISTVTQLANTLQIKLSDAEGNINTLTQTASSLQSTIKGVRDDLDGLEAGGTNLNKDSNNFSASRLISWDGARITVTENVSVDEWGATDATNIFTTSGNETGQLKALKNITNDITTVVGETYTVSVYVKNNRAERSMEVRINGIEGFPVTTIEPNEAKRVVVTGKRNENFLQIQFRAYGTTFYMDCTVWRAQVEEGNMVTPWSPAYEDMATQSQISQLNNAINLRVEKGDVIHQINLDTSGAYIGGNKIVLDGNVTVLGAFRVDSGHITSLNAGKITTGTLDAGRLNVINVSANSIVGGILQSQNSNTTFNMNSGLLTMRNVNFVLGNGAMIEFTNVSNRIQYSDTEGGVTRSSGFGVGKSLSGFPFAYSGTTGSSNLDTLSPYWSGAIWNTTRAITDGASNSISGFRFQFRAQAVDWDRGLEIDFNGSPSITPINGANYNYNLGNNDRMFNDLYVRRLRTTQNFDVRNVANINKGWLFETSESGGTMSIRGLNGGSYTYVLGDTESYNHFSYGYITNLRAPSSGNSSVGLSDRPYTFAHFSSLNVYGTAYAEDFTRTSDRRLKDNIQQTKLGLSFINQLNPVDYTMIDSVKIQTGFIAQELVGVFIKNNYINQGIVSEDGRGYLGISYTNLIAPTIRAVQELDSKVDNKVQNLEEIIEKQAFEIADLKQRLNKLEVA
ncbi:phage tail spike protein [Oceanobacillus jeddahense]|uniref:phage tail spike protein n=1 Tax=Oceanobacillus jeddahense TaxID=1462527 RepID=UPI00059611EE|nr:phage tail spike protein [Oceanobacillus jeddahense]